MLQQSQCFQQTRVFIFSTEGDLSILLQPPCFRQIQFFYGEALWRQKSMIVQKK